MLWRAFCKTPADHSARKKKLISLAGFNRFQAVAHCPSFCSADCPWIHMTDLHTINVLYVHFNPNELKTPKCFAYTERILYLKCNVLFYLMNNKEFLQMGQKLVLPEATDFIIMTQRNKRLHLLYRRHSKLIHWIFFLLLHFYVNSYTVYWTL